MQQFHWSRIRWVLALLMGISLFALGWLASRTIFNPLPGATSAEVRFTRMMEAHHQQAIAMALTIYNRSSDEELRSVALDIMQTQQTQIGQMQGWMAVWGQPMAAPVAAVNDPAMAGHTTMGSQPMPGMATQQQVNALSTLPVPDAERSMLQLMIRHHEGAVIMAKDVLTQTKRPEVVRLAQAIVASQQNEIRTLQAMLAARQ